MSQEQIPQFPKYDYEARDKILWETMENMFEKHNFTTEQILRNWPAYILRRDLPRLLAHYELFKQVIDLPGNIIELGIYKGASFFTWANLLESFCSTDRHRKVFGFDHFEGLKKDQFTEQDGATDAWVHKQPEEYKCSAEEIRALVQIHNADNMLPGAERCRLIEGDVLETLPQFLKDNPGLKISLLHLDMDLYLPTKFALELLYPLVVTGGIICFDEYGLIPWEGETRAVDEFFANFPAPPVIKKFPFVHIPHGYMIKQCNAPIKNSGARD
jgi:hypothetical protein